MTPIVPLKRCTGSCGRELPATKEFFYPKKRGKFGLTSCCRSCNQEIGQRYYYANFEKEQSRRKARYQANKERESERQRRYRQNNPDKERARRRLYREKNKDVINQKSRAYRRANLERIREHDRKRYQDNPQRVYLAKQRRRARQAHTGGSFSAEDARVQLKMQTDRKGIARCWWCNAPLGDDQSIDHRIPLSRGGSNDARNICITHLRCNLSKQDKLPHEWNGRLL